MKLTFLQDQWLPLSSAQPCHYCNEHIRSQLGCFPKAKNLTKKNRSFRKPYCLQVKRLCISKVFFIALCLQFIGNHERSSVALGNTTGESCSISRREKPQPGHTRFVGRCLCCSWWALSPDIITLFQYLHMQRARESRKRFKPEIFQLFCCFTHFLLKEATSICVTAKNQYLKTAT